MPNHAKRIQQERASVIEPAASNVIEIENDPIFIEDYIGYRVMFCARTGGSAPALWLHGDSHGQPGCFAWYDIWHIVPTLTSSTKQEQSIILRLRNGDHCEIKGRHLEGLMARLSRHQVLDVWAYDAQRWPEKPVEGEAVVTGISYAAAS